MIELRSISKSYREGIRTRVVLDRADARFARGEFVVLLGRSGSGKSTVLNLVAGIDLPDAGEVRIDGRNQIGLADRDRTLWRRRQVGFVFQFFNLIPTLSTLENLLLPLELNGVAARPARAAALEMLERVGLADRADSFPDVLSGGEQQRVAIGRALVHGPAVILADEPTGNLDPETAEATLALLVELAGESGATLLAATHSGRVARAADRVLRIEACRLVEPMGSHGLADPEPA